MKYLFFAVVIYIAAVAAGDNKDRHVIRITGTKFPFAIMERWMHAYNESHPGIKFELSKAIPSDSADLFIAAHAFEPGELKEEQVLIAVTRYAQLPIVNDQRPDLGTLEQMGLSQKDMANIFFYPDTATTGGYKSPFNVYKRDKNVCATRSFAEGITGKKQDIYGENVNGDDRALSAAVKNDTLGISYNNLGLIYDLQTRKVTDGLAIVPIDLNENGIIEDDEKIYNSLDQVLDFLSTTGSDKIPQENVNIIINEKKISKDALQFLRWIITDGQQYNRQFGFLDLEKSVVREEQHLIDQFLSTVSK